ncbi:MAG: hypothetical protein WBX25_35980 [Rhodomicrobium sp.]
MGRFSAIVAAIDGGNTKLAAIAVANFSNTRRDILCQVDRDRWG